MNPLAIVLVVILVLLLIGGLPSLGFHHYGWGPSSGLGILLIVIIAVLLLR